MGIFEDIGGALGKIVTAGAPIAASYFESRRGRPASVVYADPYAAIGGGPPVGSTIFPTAPMGAPMYTPTVRPASLPSTILRNLPSIGGGIALGELAEGAMSLFGGGGGDAFFSPATGRARPMRTIVQMHPETGQPHWWEHRGRPIAYTSDLSAARRLARCARFGTSVRRRVKGTSRRRKH